jgi:hypothetical protein
MRDTGSAAGKVATEQTPAPRDHADEQCNKLIGHALSLAVAERPTDQQLTADERTNIELQLRKSWVPSCRTMSSRGYDCAIAAHSLAELDSCAR